MKSVLIQNVEVDDSLLRNIFVCLCKWSALTESAGQVCETKVLSLVSNF